MKVSELKDLRESKGLTQREVAEKTGISHVSVLKIENSRPVYRATFIVLCNFLGVNPDSVENANIHDGKAVWKDKVRRKHAP